MANACWMAVWYQDGGHDGDMWVGYTHYGRSFANSREAWDEARRLCEEFDGVGFAARRIEPVNHAREAS